MGDWTRRRWIASSVGISGLGGIPDMARAFDPLVPESRRPRSRMKISSFRSTLVASPDEALLRSWGVHDTHFRRSIVELETADGFKGAAEMSGQPEENFAQARDAVLGRDPFEIERFRRTIKSISIFGAVETACLDLVGKVINRRVVDLLGGPYREEMRYSAYVFFVLPTPGGREIITPEAVTKEFVDLCAKYGFRSLKFKGGVLHPDREIEALEAMRAAKPDAPLRIDPNAAWSVETAVRVAKAIEPLKMEYFEDPSPGMDGMAEVRKKTTMPLATNMVVTQVGHIAPAFRKESIDIVLLDNHYMGGLTTCRHWAAICESLGWGCSGHSNNHLGLSMAAMTHMNCAISRVSYDADTHYPWTTQDVIKGPMLQFKDGKMALPDAPGLGVEVDPDKLAALKENVAKARDRRALLDQWVPGYPNHKPGTRTRW
jgi:glucarate dehydratase